MYCTIYVNIYIFGEILLKIGTILGHFTDAPHLTVPRPHPRTTDGSGTTARRSFHWPSYPAMSSSWRVLAAKRHVPGSTFLGS